MRCSLANTEAQFRLRGSHDLSRALHHSRTTSRLVAFMIDSLSDTVAALGQGETETLAPVSQLSFVLRIVGYTKGMCFLRSYCSLRPLRLLVHPIEATAPLGKFRHKTLSNASDRRASESKLVRVEPRLKGSELKESVDPPMRNETSICQL